MARVPRCKVSVGRLLWPAVSIGLLLTAAGSVVAQESETRLGTHVPTEVKTIYVKGLDYLARTQTPDGTWESPRAGAGITGLCVMAFLAGGEDPNFGPYRTNIRRGLESIIRSQDPNTGYLQGTMYHHGFAMLALAEAYGAVDEDRMWQGKAVAGRRSIAKSLELAVQCAVTAQKKNPHDGWRYSPDATDMDTSVSGAILVGLLAARNAGIAVPDETIDKALAMYQSHTSSTGQVRYSRGSSYSSSTNVAAIATLVLAIGRRKETEQFKAALGYISKHASNSSQFSRASYLYYGRYYTSQALYQGDFDAWTQWNREMIQTISSEQKKDGSFSSGHGDSYATAMTLLTLAVNYRFLPIYER